MHGCTLLNGIYHTVTRMEGANLYELDGRPIVGIIDEIYGDTSWQDQHPVVSLLAVGINCGDRFEEPAEGNFVTRLIIGVLPDKAGLRFSSQTLRRVMKSSLCCGIPQE